jgi:hypothetical protein
MPVDDSGDEIADSRGVGDVQGGLLDPRAVRMTRGGVR